jgi:hypothetical protein
MARMIELMKQAAVPANVMRSAARGALALPPGEMIEILVYLTANPVFAETARMTLAAWDEKASIEVCKDPNTSWEVLEYWIAPQNRRPKLVPALLENPTLREARIIDMAQTGAREIVDMMLASERVRKSADILHALATNAHLSVEEANKINDALKNLGDATGEMMAVAEDGQKTQWEIEHAAEIEAEEKEGKAFVLIGPAEDEDPAVIAAATGNAPPGELTMKISAELAKIDGTAAVPGAPGAAAGAAAAPAPTDAAAPKPEADTRERVSTIQKIARLRVGDRVQLAMKGNKEERFVLIRDGSKVVSSAVLESPKLTDSEVETFAGMKNVQESVLRGIAMKRKFMKNYAVIRALVNNPRCPLDLGLTLMNHMLVNDLKALSMNKNVSETLRKMALKNYKQKVETKGGGGGGH